MKKTNIAVLTLAVMVLGLIASSVYAADFLIRKVRPRKMYVSTASVDLVPVSARIFRQRDEQNVLRLHCKVFIKNVGNAPFDIKAARASYAAKNLSTMDYQFIGMKIGSYPSFASFYGPTSRGGLVDDVLKPGETGQLIPLQKNICSTAATQTTVSVTVDSKRVWQKGVGVFNNDVQSVQNIQQ